MQSGDPQTYVGAHLKPDRRLDVSRLRRPTRQLQQGRDGLDDHNARRRTGILHSTCVRYLDTADGFLVWGTASGAPRDPDWFRNLRKAKIADVQIRAKTLQVRPRELLGEERDAAWKDVVLAQAPEVEKYAQRAGRTIPVALLQPVEGPLR
jgi:deazaflavin-dependent oxidoreductase (nitroreductase family)